MKVQSTLYDRISGSIKNITGAQGLGGSYLKTKPNPKNPNTARQQVVRGGMTAANIAWLGLGQSVRDLWEVYGKTLTRTNQTGATVILTGWNAFSRAYTVFKQVGQDVAPLLLAAPTTAGYHDNGVLALVYDAATGNSIKNNGTEAIIVAAYAGKTTRQTINSYGGSFQFQGLHALAADGEGVINAAPADGKNWVRTVTLSADGRVSRGQRFSLVK